MLLAVIRVITRLLFFSDDATEKQRASVSCWDDDQSLWESKHFRSGLGQVKDQLS